MSHYYMFVSFCLCIFVLNSGAQTITKTEQVDFPPGSLLRLHNSTGELTVEGWDRPEVEITTIKSTTKAAYGSEETESASHDLDRVRITTERRGNEVVVTTDFPRYAVFPPPLLLRGNANFDLEYRIKVPRNAPLVINHDTGEVHIDSVAGDIHVSVFKGGITLRLSADDQYAIDARSDIGNVFSDFAGQEHRRPWLLGHRFAQKASPDAHQLYLRVGFGDIAILKIRKPPYALAVNPPSGLQP